MSSSQGSKRRIARWTCISLLHADVLIVSTHFKDAFLLLAVIWFSIEEDLECALTLCNPHNTLNTTLFPVGEEPRCDTLLHNGGEGRRERWSGEDEKETERQTE